MPGLERRRRWSIEEKLRILAQSIAPGSSPALTCKLHGISSGQLYTWRKQFRRGELTGFVPVSAHNSTPGQPGRERRHTVRRPLPEHLPREEIIHPAGDICPGCGGTHFSKLGR
jgi:transposase-like protein